MKIRTPSYYEDFACIGGDCPDTCCAGWEVDVDKTTSAYYRSVEGPFGDRLRSMLIDCPIEDRFILQEHGRCPFLNKANLCDIYEELGEDKLCGTCTNFPRHITEYGSTREIGISLSCPVAAELIMKRKEPISFVTGETQEKISSYNDIDADLYFALERARSVAYAVCQNRRLPVNERAALCLDYAKKLQKNMKRPKRILAAAAEYADETCLAGRLEKLKKKSRRRGNEDRVSFLMSWLSLYSELEHIKEEWPPLLLDTENYLKNKMPDYEQFDILIKRREYEYEHLLVYYIYRYFLRAVFDGRLCEKVKLGCAALIMQRLIGAVCYHKNGSFSFLDQTSVMRIYSKETEHSEENLARIYKEFKRNKIFSCRVIADILLSGA